MDDCSQFREDLSCSNADEDGVSVGGFSECETEISEGSVLVAKEDIKLMNVVRAIVILILLTVAFITGESVFVIATIAEQDSFRSSYAAAATVVIDTFYERLEQRLWVARGLSTSLSASALQTGAAWPNVTFDHFEARCASPRQMTNATMITLNPLLKYNNRASWESYAARTYPTVIAEDNDSSSSLSFLWDHEQQSTTAMTGPQESGVTYFPTDRTVDEGIYKFQQGTAVTQEDSFRMLFPMWQTAPAELGSGAGSATAPDGLIGTLFNEMSAAVREMALERMVMRDGSILSEFMWRNASGTDFANYATPAASLYYPLHDGRQEAVAALNMELQWETFLQHAPLNIEQRQHHQHSLYVVVENACGGSDDEKKNEGNAEEEAAAAAAAAANGRISQATYLVRGLEAAFMGAGDLHDEDVDGYTPTNSSYARFNDIMNKHGREPLQSLQDDGSRGCPYQLHVYATEEFKNSYLTNRADIYRAMVLAVFLSMVGVFIVYDCLVERRQNRVVDAAERSDAIVRSLFPSTVRNRLYENAKSKHQQANGKNGNDWKVGDDHHQPIDPMCSIESLRIETPKNRLRNFMSSSPADQAAQSADHNHGAVAAGGDGGGGGAAGNNAAGANGVEPIADLFPHATVLFADIAGFTAWSSEREPTQVFALLETLFRAMDKAAKRFGVFKVETVGDCYVAATGIPDPQKDHAVIMVRFARTCLHRVNELTGKLQSQLGPGTSDLSMRFGIHSGPVTAGVLRGQKARFQLFGDTMNMASRMESAGLTNKIHISQETADLLSVSGHSTWVTPRKDKVTLKGKGSLQTYWLVLGSNHKTDSSTNSSTSGDCNLLGGEEPGGALCSIWAGCPHLENVLGRTKIDDKISPMVDWNVDVLLVMLKRVVAHRIVSGAGSTHLSSSLEKKVGGGGLVLDEIEMVINMPDFDVDQANRALKEQVELVPAVRNELRDYVACIASGYRRNYFHNFEHASHVILSANKLIKRICTPDEVGPSQKTDFTTEDLNEHTYGIGTDPLTHFAVTFSALIHDVGHTGVPNGQLAKEDPPVADKYVHKSIAEQRSVDIAWELLLLPHFKNLRACIYQNKADCQRFRSLIVNSVMATDIFDKELKQLRNSRWDLAFRRENVQEQAMTKQDTHRKATIVIEHIIQASDVAHTMQHWNIYQKWNERLFREMYFAYLQGRSEKDPSVGWFGGEIWFFDNYIIPLAGKLKECGVFGVSHDEYLNYARQNRKEWEQKGQATVAVMKERADMEAEKLGLITRMHNIQEESESAPSRSSIDDDDDDDHTDDEEEEVDDQITIMTDDDQTVDAAVVAGGAAPPPPTRVIEAPAGKLGLVLDTTPGGTYVHSVDDTSPLLGQIVPGDCIVSIDSVETKGMSAQAISALLHVNMDHPKKFSVVSSAAAAAGDNCAMAA